MVSIPARLNFRQSLADPGQLLLQFVEQHHGVVQLLADWSIHQIPQDDHELPGAVPFLTAHHHNLATQPGLRRARMEVQPVSKNRRRWKLLLVWF